MTKITISPTIPLTEYAKAHLEELNFGPQDELQWLLLPAQPEIFEKRDLNFFGRLVKKLLKSNYLIVHITSFVATVFLTISLIGIPSRINVPLGNGSTEKKRIKVRYNSFIERKE